MANKNIKALVIKVKPSSEPGGVEYKWDSLTSRMPSFTKDIITPALSVDKDGKSEVNIGAIVSGMPTVFARANMFVNALNAISDKAASVDGLLGFYKSLLSEWRGIIACIALDYSEIKVRRVFLTYTDGKTIANTENLYEPKGAFGNVLFERASLWADQTKSGNSFNPPFIDVIQYKGVVVGGTSPESFLFTSVSYRIEEDQPFVDLKSRVFTDPLNSDILPDKLSVVYGYVKHLINNVESFRKQFDGLSNLLKPSYGNLQGNLQDWIKEMEQYASTKGFVLKEDKPELTSFEAPFNVLFNHSTELFGSEGTISTDSTMSGAIKFDPKNLLLPEGSEIAQIDFGAEGAKTKDFLRNRAIYILQAETKDEKGLFSYFALPLSPLALDVFGKNIGSLIGIEENNVKSRLIAEYDPNSDELEVTLKIFMSTSDNPINKTQKYKVGKELKNQDILLWPNFISKKWGKYFMYSELPHNDDKYRATPFVGDMEDEYFRIVNDETNTPVYLSENGKIKPISDPILKEKVKSKLHVVSDNRVSDNKYKYEIYESNLPFKGVKFSYGNRDCGFVIIRYGTNQDAVILNKLQDNNELADANLGIDFGSTNTSVAYYSKRSQQTAGMTFKNRRISLFASDNKDNDARPAVEDEVFFFQNDEIKSNAIKSILTLHDFKRVVKDSDSQTNESLASQAVKGGFPCFEKNLPVEDASDNRIFLNYHNAGRVEIVQNMKWSNQEIENSYKTAYLSSLLLHIYAQLFEEGHRPASLKWSYPSAMSNNLIRQYIQIWTKLNEVNPLNDGSKLVIFNPVTSMNISMDSGSSWSNGASNNAGWGGSSDTASSSSGWGAPAAAPAATGWGDAPSATPSNVGSSLKEINTESGPINFDFKVLGAEESLTESCAVANYIANSGNVSTDMRYLTICFDVGGSTTDIMALCNMTGPQGMGLAMVKQNSIRFAAQRVSQATKHSKNFKAVMIEMCERKKITIQGLNKGDNKFAPNTAPYYFEQLVDRLDDTDFDAFYQLLAGRCPELMCVNLFVTGLIMYYAGQLAAKLRTEVINSPNKLPGMENWKPIVNIIFAGKGARIFDWLKANNPQNSKEYYETLFIKGFGGIQSAQQLLSGPPNINPTNSEGSLDIKYEVSKGLAQTTQKLFVPQNNVAIELLGEDNFIVLTASGQQKQVKSEDSITPEMMESIGSYFLASPPQGGMPCPRFMDFADVYFKIATGMFGLPLTQQDFMQGFNNMNIASYIKQLPEYKLAQESKQKGDSQEFDFIAPLIILEGMKFLEDVIYKKIAAN